MELKYYVLGKENNEILLSYLDKYYEKLLKILQALQNESILISRLLSSQQSGNKEFILYPDISSLIQAIYSSFSKENNLKRLEVEIEYFLSGSNNSIVNKGNNIFGTNIKLTLNDNNPYNTFDTHPDHDETGGNLGWGKKTEKEWLSIYEKTFRLLKKVDKGFYEELNHIIKKIVPLGTSIDTHNSASYGECIGSLYLGFTINSNTPEINNVEAIIHESSHNKLNLLFQFDPIILNTKEEIYYSAIRPDARPLRGVFIGYHAFAPTMYVIMKAYKEGMLGNDKLWFDKIVLYYIKTKILQKTIKKYGYFTELGQEICREIDYVIVQMDNLIKDLKLTKDDIVRAKKMQEKHFNEVNEKYLYLKY